MSLASAFEQLNIPNNAKPRSSSTATKQALKTLLNSSASTNAVENHDPNTHLRLVEEELKRLREDPYLALDLPCSATPTEIKKQYRKLSLEYHPDKTSSAATAPIFQVINHAYNTLKDPALRLAYDQTRPAAPTDNFIPKARRRRSRPIFNSNKNSSNSSSSSSNSTNNQNSNSSSNNPPTSAHHEGADQPSFIDDGRNSKIMSVTFSPSIVRVGANSFLNATSLLSVALPNTVRHIKSSAFKGCVNLHTINLSSVLETLGPYTFNGCANLRSINLPGTLTAIGPYCFSYCKLLNSINIPDAVVEFGSNAFSFCHELGLDKKIPLNDTALVIDSLRSKQQQQQQEKESSETPKTK
ncbi:hypothetical protein TrST_g8297 [Triparma strigata]|uniref:J domain-containing protein n=1 Tax=Triparma strigata TaxID=1606541 RepID=A0A9W6ZSN7_9STRA|nr:hypothetical protein TrST_g8297 [Triparma strigata]